jgi:hypothetical protein
LENNAMYSGRNLPTLQRNLLSSTSEYASTLKMVAACCSETADLFQKTWPHIPKASDLQSPLQEPEILHG